MSRPLFSWRHAILNSGLQPTTRHVLLTLSCYMTDTGDSCFPSTRRLAAETGLSERAVITHLRKAKEAGWLKVSIHGFGGQRWKAHEYTVAIPEGTERRSAASEKGTEPHSKGTEPDDKKALNEVQSISSENSSENSSLGGKPKNGRRKDELFEAVVAECGMVLSELTKPERGKANKAVKAIRDVGATPADVHARAQSYRKRWPNCDVTPTGLANNWSKLKGPTSEEELWKREAWK